MKKIEGKKEKFREENRKVREEEGKKDKLASWNPKTEIGRLVKQGKLKDIDEIIETDPIIKG